MTSTKTFTVTFKVAEAGAPYEHQEDKGGNKAGDVTSSTGGHMWYSISDGVNPPESYGFSSRYGEPFGEGRVSTNDDLAYRVTAYETTVQLTEDQYNNLKNFSTHPELQNFDAARYRVFTNSCVDFTFKALETIGYKITDFEGNLLPQRNIEPLKELLYSRGATIVRDTVTRNGDYYQAKDGQVCMWLNPNDIRTPPASYSPVNLDVTSAPAPQQKIQGESQAQLDVSNGYIKRSPTDTVYALGGILNETDFTSSQMAGLATGGVRPGEVQIDPNARPNSYLSSFYAAPEAQKPDFSLNNVMTVNNLTTKAKINTYVDPLLLDLTGNGVRMTDLRDAVLFDTDHSGTLKRSGWADRSTGMLVVDDGSGQVANVSQMFSEYYGGKPGGVARPARSASRTVLPRWAARMAIRTG